MFQNQERVKKGNMRVFENVKNKKTNTIMIIIIILKIIITMRILRLININSNKKRIIANIVIDFFI